MLSEDVEMVSTYDGGVFCTPTTAALTVSLRAYAGT